jgi:hypothetical protein
MTIPSVFTTAEVASLLKLEFRNISRHRDPNILPVYRVTELVTQRKLVPLNESRFSKTTGLLFAREEVERLHGEINEDDARIAQTAAVAHQEATRERQNETKALHRPLMPGLNNVLGRSQPVALNPDPVAEAASQEQAFIAVDAERALQNQPVVGLTLVQDAVAAVWPGVPLAQRLDLEITITGILHAQTLPPDDLTLANRIAGNLSERYFHGA